MVGIYCVPPLYGSSIDGRLRTCAHLTGIADIARGYGIVVRDGRQEDEYLVGTIHVHSVVVGLRGSTLDNDFHTCMIGHGFQLTLEDPLAIGIFGT